MTTAEETRTIVGSETARICRLSGQGDNAAAPARRRRPGLGQHAAMLAVAGALLLAMAAQPAQGQGLTTLYAFKGKPTYYDGAGPQGTLIMDTSGNLYGTTAGGGAGNTYGFGTVFELVYNSPGSYAEKVLYDFPESKDGEIPQGALVRDASGNLYGTTCLGGASNGGTVFELVNNPPGTYTHEVLYNFPEDPDDGLYPRAPLIMDASGNLYGTTSAGGSYGYGTVFELVYNSPGNYTEYVLYNFKGEKDGATPIAALIRDASGNLYGTTNAGTKYNSGTVFELVYKSPETYTEQTLYTFTGGKDGGSPWAPLIMDASGNLFGTTTAGGANDAGTVFELVAGSYKEKVLYSFTGGADGGDPLGALLMNKSGDLYGTTNGSGADYYGTVIELASNSPENYTEYTLYTFTGGNDGGAPYAGVIMDKLGNLYGTADVGGLHHWGTAFELTPPIIFSQFAAAVEVVPPIPFTLPAEFDLDGSFTLGAKAAALTPPTEAMTLTVGTYTVSIPSGSFQVSRDGTYYSYFGVINGVALDIFLEPTGKDSYNIEVTASGENLTNLGHSTTVTLTIGDNLGKTEATDYNAF